MTPQHSLTMCACHKPRNIMPHVIRIPRASHFQDSHLTFGRLTTSEAIVRSSQLSSSQRTRPPVVVKQIASRQTRQISCKCKERLTNAGQLTPCDTYVERVDTRHCSGN